MKCLCAVTFEFDVSAPITWRGTVTATGLQTIVSRAVTKAKDKHPNTQWSSVVVTVLERLDKGKVKDVA